MLIVAKSEIDVLWWLFEQVGLQEPQSYQVKYLYNTFHNTHNFKATLQKIILSIMP